MEDMILPKNPQKETTLPTASSWTSSLKQLETINASLRHPVHGHALCYSGHSKQKHLCVGDL